MPPSRPTSASQVTRLEKRTQLTVLGLNAGTSADGLDLAVVRLSRRGPDCGGQVKTSVVGGSRRAYPADIRHEILRMADSRTVELNHLLLLHEALGAFYGRSAARYVRKLARSGIRVDLVASHGQTVRHLPMRADFLGHKLSGTMQLGSLERIAAATGCVTAGDFRQADVALGGEGAPITVAAMARLFGDPTEPRLIVNIGGMANYFYFPAGANPTHIEAADCGPGNSLCDLLAQRLYNQPFDKGGRCALAGKASQRLLSLLLADPFFTSATVSTGRETFGPAMVERMVQFGNDFGLSPDDLLATAAELTVIGIAESVWLLIDDNRAIQKLYLTGGGARNKFFSRRLSRIFDRVKVTTVRELGVDPGLVEAAAYAVMGEACLRGEALPTRFGGGKRPNQKHKPVSGKLVQPPR